MANIEDIDAQLHLPEDIIQHIQSFLTRKEAASTVVLSKSWYKAWLTHPVLDFDERNFPSAVQFLNFATTSMERYHELNLNIDTFNLWMNARDTYSFSRATELIVKALKMGAINLNLEFPRFSFLLPKELFESECLVELSAVGGIISRVDVICPRLKSLSLHLVQIKDAMLRDIILYCPWLENLHLDGCFGNGIDEVNVGRMVNIKNLTIIRGSLLIYLRKKVEERRRKTPLVHFDENGSAVQFSCLTSLLLDNVKIDEMLFCDFFSKFPCVKDLTVQHCDGCDKFDISSPTINSISLAHTKRLKIQLNVPNIRKFKFSGETRFPTLSVGSASREWESVIELSCKKEELSFLWFRQLNNFLTSLSTSKITLDIKLMMVTDIENLPEFAGNYFKPMVESLTLELYSILSDSGNALVDGLCMCFRPKFIKLCLFNANGPRANLIRQQLHKQSKELAVVLIKKLMYPTRLQQDIEQANLEILEDEEWRPVDWTTFLNDVPHREKGLHMRFCLSWTQN